MRIVSGDETVILNGQAEARLARIAAAPRRRFRSEAALVDAARSLDTAAWSEIYDRHYDRVYAYLYYRFGRREVAEDLAADVFVRALSGIRTFSYRGTPLLAWLFRIAHNVAVDHRKAASRRDMLDTPGLDVEAAVAQGDLAEEAAQRQDVRAALTRLTEDQQQVLFLRFYQGMSNADVAVVLRKGEGAVKALQVRALKSLRRLMGGSDGAAGNA